MKNIGDELRHLPQDSYSVTEAEGLTVFQTDCCAIAAQIEISLYRNDYTPYWVIWFTGRSGVTQQFARKRPKTEIDAVIADLPPGVLAARREGDRVEFFVPDAAQIEPLAEKLRQQAKNSSWKITLL